MDRVSDDPCGSDPVEASRRSGYHRRDFEALAERVPRPRGKTAGRPPEWESVASAGAGDGSRGDTDRDSGPAVAVDYRLVHRITYGFTEEEAELFRRLGHRGYLEYHLNHEAIRDDYVDYRLTEFSSLNASGSDFQNLDWWTCVHETVQAHVLRALFSKRQLYERMVEFWCDHFNVYVNKIGKLNTLYQRDVIRRHAMGKFPDLLMAVAKSAAMLEYLDNTSNVSSRPNENYARELLELHTLSIDGGYPEDDVLDVGRCFTGWTYQWREEQPTFGQFVFDAASHDNARKYFLGIEIPSNGGIRDGERIIEILSAHPKTARFLATKLLRHFLTYEPSEALIAAVARTYTETGGDIRSMLRTILSERNVARYATPKFKRPMHWLISGLRATKASVPFIFSLWWGFLEKSGNTPFFWPAPNGYQDRENLWVDIIQPKWQFAQNYSLNWIWQVTMDTFGLIRTRTPKGVVNRLDWLLFGGNMPAAEKVRLLAYLPANPTADDVREAVGLALAMPAFNRY